MIRARFNYKHCKLTIIHCYALTHEAEKKDWDDWYKEFQHSETEVKSAIKATKNGKAEGIDSIHAEMLKDDLNTTVMVLTDLFRNIWDRNVIPEDWTRGLIAKIQKKGNLQNCNNSRGITMLSIILMMTCLFSPQITALICKRKWTVLTEWPNRWVSILISPKHK